MSQHESDVTRLENLWSGEFGDAYIERNRHVSDVRGPFWETLLDRFPVRRALEVGCNIGANLRWVRERVPDVYGADVNAGALAELRRTLSDVNAVRSPGRDLPFRDKWFDLVFTMGVLIHQSPDALPLMMTEIVRCSSRYVLCGEYFSEQPVEVSYRGQPGSLFKRDFGALYLKLFPELTLRASGFLSKDQGWDDITWWMFEKTHE